MTAFVEIVGLKKQYAPQPGAKDGLFAVNGIDLTINTGEIFSLLGPNGAGKTTTISMMSGLLTPTAGDVIIGGHSVIKEPMVVKRMIGVVPQEIALYPQLSARNNLEFFGKLYGMGGVALQKRCDEVLEFIGLTDRQHDRVDSYSGGMKRRVNIGVGLLHQPKLVFMDEPTVGIDPQSRRSILDAVKLLNQQGMTVLYTTHYMEEAEELSDRIAIVDHGKVIALGTEGELIQKIGEKDTIKIKIGDAGERAAAAVRPLAGVDGVTIEEDRIVIVAGRGRQVLPAAIKALDEASLAIHGVEIKEPNLEAVFLELTGRALRD
jgi:ABC-2 type transport system ATP-binding protein